LTEFLEEAGRWFLRSGIQESSGGVARYYRSDSRQNAPVSNEITGYAVSALVYLHQVTGIPEYLDAALRAARFLMRDAWSGECHTIPFEPGSAHAYFFDVGIIVRGLLAAWRATGGEEFRSRARDAALSLAFDFMDRGIFHPVISLPDKQPLPAEPRWSRRPGCYQLKAALAWFDLGDQDAIRLFESVLASALATHEAFLREETDREKIMDRLHAYCYFLEALLAVAERPECRRALKDGIDRVASLRREIAPAFERSDVTAQLLRLRLIAHHLGAVPLDEKSACEEAAVVSSYQAASEDPRIHGGFWFGQKRTGRSSVPLCALHEECSETTPFVNPASTAFALQALELWREQCTGTWRFQLNELI
jgi:hypothetical protein